MDIADHQSSWVEPSGWWTKFTSLPYTTMVPLAMALSRIFWSAASAFAISAHCGRGIFQNDTYEYIGGFSLTSDICALDGAIQTADIAIAHSPAKTLHSFLFIKFILRDLAHEVQVGPWATVVYTNHLILSRVLSLVRRVRILHRTAIGTRRRCFYLLSGHRLLQRETDVIGRARDVVQVGCGFVVNRSIVDHYALGVDDDHLRRCLGVVKMPNLTDRVEQRGGRRRLHLRQVVVLFLCGRIALLARRRRQNCEPDYALAGPLLL